MTGRSSSVRRRVLLAGAAVLALLVWLGLMTYPKERIQGVNLLQSRVSGFDQPPTLASFRRLRAIGGNSVALIPFIRQASPGARKLEVADAVTWQQLVGAIRYARKAGLRVFLKPQLLIQDSWAGAVDQPDDAGWRAWFDAYGRILLEYAQFAEREGLEMLVIGTELKRAGQRPEWEGLIAAVRRVYSGELSYSAHNLDGLQGFAHWQRLDSAAVTLYPALGESGEHQEMARAIADETQALRRIAEGLPVPLWIAEVGIASREGAYRDPWEWRFPADVPPQPDQQLQAEVLDLWLSALEGDWNRGVLVWAWYNDPRAGGQRDVDFTPQNKLAERVLRCHWGWYCIPDATIQHARR